MKANELIGAWNSDRQYLRNRLLSLRLALVAATALFLMAGCSIRVRMGYHPNIDALERTLRVGESTQSDVVLALGQPFGKGQLMFPTDPKPRTLWSYYYGEGDMEDARNLFLFVFFAQDRYDGYMWFSSLKEDIARQLSPSPTVPSAVKPKKP